MHPVLQLQLHVVQRLLQFGRLKVALHGQQCLQFVGVAHVPQLGQCGNGGDGDDDERPHRAERRPKVGLKEHVHVVYRRSPARLADPARYSAIHAAVQ